MIVEMQKLRIVGPRERLPDVLAVLQDLEVVHLCPPTPDPPLRPLQPSDRKERHERQVRSAIDDAEEALSRLGGTRSSEGAAARDPTSLLEHVRVAHRSRRVVAALDARRELVEEERERLRHLQRVLATFADMEPPGPSMRCFYLLLSRDVADALPRLERALEERLGRSFSLHARPLDAGEQAVALLVPSEEAEPIDSLLPEVGLRELDVPGAEPGAGTGAALRAVEARMAALDAERSRLDGRRQALAEARVPALERAQAALHDWLLRSEALARAATTEHLFVIEGWLPESARAGLEDALRTRAGDALVVEAVGRERWAAEDVPVAIRNPRVFRPFELITGRLPMPRYGSMDPTPFVAVFFPMFFGLILGDMGYGAALLLLATVGWLRSREGGILRSLSQIGVACGVFAVAFGLCFGEFFGDLGRRWFGLEALAFSREQAFVPFLVLVVAIGFAHVLLGLVVGALSALRSDPRRSAGRGLAALMLVLVLLLLLAAVEVLPAAFFTPAALALLIAFPILVAIEGMIGPIELLSRFSNILSYARIMALGTASVMLATVANQMAGAFGSAVVGVLFAALFHLVNFGLGLFSPTIHALRLHFVEFFGTFYSPGGLAYHPFRHWCPADAPGTSNA